MVPVGGRAELENDRVSLRNDDLWNCAQGVNPYPHTARPGGVVNISERSTNGIENKPGRAQKPVRGQISGGSADRDPGSKGRTLGLTLRCSVSATVSASWLLLM